MFHFCAAILLLFASSIANGPAIAGILFSHSGNSDPVNNGWAVNEPAISPGGRPSTGGITNDDGTGLSAWFIDDDLITIGSSWFYEQTPTATQIMQGNSFGWTLRARVRLVDIPDTPGSSGSVSLEFANGTTSYNLSLGTQDDGDPVAEFAGGPSITLQGAGSGYHLYEIVYDPVDGTVDLYIDGIERISKFSGVPSTLFTRVIWGSASSGDTGQGNWNLVEWDIKPAVSNTTVRMQTDIGGIDIQLFDDATPLTVTNFMNYVNDADYDGSFIHRSIPGFVLQMGGFIFDPAVDNFFTGGQIEIPEDPPVVNEPGLSNVRATIAMAKIPEFDANGNPIPGGGPDSATNQFFFNLSDNSANLDNQNGGFTVFAQISGNDMDVIDAISALPLCGNQISLCGTPNGETPIVGLTPDEPPLVFLDPVKPENLVLIQGIGFDSDSDGIIDRIEDAAPNGGDGNNDTINDRDQANIASFKLFSGGHAMLESAINTTFISANALGPAYAFTTYSLNNIPPFLADFTFAYGYYDFELLGESPGSATKVKLTLPPNDATPDTYFNYGPTSDNPAPHWYTFQFDGETGAEFNGNVITLHYADGKRGDADLDNTNGIIAAPGGPAKNLNGDTDGIPDIIEDGAPNSGDGNSDGIEDKLQNSVASLVDIRNNYVTIEVNQALSLNSLIFSDGVDILSQSDLSDKLSGLNFAHGFLSFEVRNVIPGDNVKVKVFLPKNEKPIRFFKYGPTPDNPADHLYDFSFNGETGAEFANNTVTLHFVDGKRGDADLIANGIIADPGAPALGADISGSNGGGGGCSIQTNKSKPLQAGDWLLLLLVISTLGVAKISRPMRKHA